MNRRQFIGASAAFAGSAAVAADEKTTDGGFAEVSWADRVAADTPVLPPGARDARRFAFRCVGCGLCAAACPSKCLRPSTVPGRFGRVEMDFRHGWCRPGCVKCGEVCPAGAIEQLSPGEKRTVHAGFAVWTKSLCIRETEGVECHACEKHCPSRAIKILNGFPVVDRAACTGCGACEHYCPARPRTAIRVAGYERHREARPMSEADLVAEMNALIAGGKACVVACGGVIVATGEGRGVKPMLEMLDKGVLPGAVVADRVCGRASAAICIEGGVRKVVSPVMAEGAMKLLEAHGVAAEAGAVVPSILNRDRSGGCPMDAATSALDDTKAIVGRLREMQ